MAEPTYERRKHKRHDVACPIWLTCDGGEARLKSRGINISDGGVLFPLASGTAPRRGSQVRLDFSLPRSTPNTFLMEEFSTRAVVVRAEPPDEEGPTRVAVRFEGPMDLGIEV